MNQEKKTCCDPFDPAPWDEKEITWDNKKFVQDQVKCFMHIPIDMAAKMKHNMELIKAADAKPEKFFMLTDDSDSNMDIYIEVTKEVPEANNTIISGTFLTKVFEGPFLDHGKWVKEMQQYVIDQGKKLEKLYTFYTTCPKCAKERGKNWVVLFAKI
ncbi:MAG: hypothetical protein KAT71_02895 [Gammaproteobacteria bacterium]|nr:hypothetical protein [Gammaproteobacteria bacterium]